MLECATALRKQNNMENFASYSLLRGSEQFWQWLRICPPCKRKDFEYTREDEAITLAFKLRQDEKKLSSLTF